MGARWSWLGFVVASTMACGGFGASSGSVDGSDGGLLPDGAPIDGGALLADGGCKAGCKPEVLVAGLSLPGRVRAGPSSVYWVSKGAVGTEAFRCPLAGCGGDPAAPLGPAAGLSVDTKSVFLMTFSEITRCAHEPPCAPQSVALATGGETFSDVSASDSMFFMARNRTSTGRVSICQAGDCSNTESDVFTGGLVSLVTQRGQDMYLVTNTAPQTLVRYRDGSPTDLGTLSDLVTSIAASENGLVFVARNRVYTCDTTLAACTPVLYDRTATLVYGVASAGADVFYSVFASGGTPGKIVRCTGKVCRDPVVLAEEGDPAALDARDGWVYYADRAGGVAGAAAIKRVPY